MSSIKINPKPTIRVADMSLRISIDQAFVARNARGKFNGVIGAFSASSV